jgi:hypothetical protein
VRWWAAVGAVLLLGGCTATPSASPSPTDALGGVHWQDHVRDCATASGGSGLGTIIDAVEKGDVNGDGRMDTLVVDECQASTSRWPSVVEVFDGASEPAHPTRLGTLTEGDPDSIRDARATVEPGGRVVVTGEGLSPTAPLCCPDLAVRKVFTFANGRFTLTETSATPLASPS